MEEIEEIRPQGNLEGTQRSAHEPDPVELEACLQRMRAASDVFYRHAVHTDCHAFIEFTGLINEFISACRDAAHAGHDFRTANRHGSAKLTLAEHQVRYIEEKLDCIYQGAVPTQTRLGSHGKTQRQ